MSLSGIAINEHSVFVRCQPFMSSCTHCRRLVVRSMLVERVLCAMLASAGIPCACACIRNLKASRLDLCGFHMVKATETFHPRVVVMTCSCDEQLQYL